MNATVVQVAVGQTPELLGRWLNQFVARMEPDEEDERMYRAMEDRYVCVRPVLDGMSYLSALMSSVDAAAVDRILTALAAAAEPGDLRTMTQRRSDALVDLLCGRVSNGCHVVWDSNSDSDDHLDDGEAQAADEPMAAEPPPPGQPAIPDDTGAPAQSPCSEEAGAVDDSMQQVGAVDDREIAEGREVGESRGIGVESDLDDREVGENVDLEDDGEVHEDRFFADQDWETSDWERPPSVFRPDLRAEPDPQPRSPEILGRNGNGTWRVTPCVGEHQVRPTPVTIGVVVSIQSLFGASNTPGQLMDRSALVAADQIRDLAQQQGTLFYRLLTDEKGHLLDVTEMGRFPSRKLGMAIKFRDGMCTGPTCHKAATECDMDHVVPHPEGPTTARNLNHDCKPEHRARTFAGHVTARTGPHTSTWTTPTGHTYPSQDPVLPVEEWPERR